MGGADNSICGLKRFNLIPKGDYMAYTMTTQKQVRDAFFASTGTVKRLVRTPTKHYRLMRQDEYPTDIRCLFVDYVDQLARSGEISEQLASRVTL
jgi:pyruvate dehydrogenase complex dehydrogenase (E1) component